MPGRIMPIEPGPMILVPYFLPASSIVTSICLPASEASPKPVDMMRAPLTPAFPHPSMISGTNGALTAITARSTGGSIAVMEG